MQRYSRSDRAGALSTTASSLVLALLVLVGLGSSGGCEVFGERDGSARRSALGDTTSIGIAFGEHIEGVTLSDDSAAVREKLGPPDEFVRGDFPSVTYRYREGAAAGLEVEIATDSLPSVGRGVAPGDLVNACVYAPYNGKTQKGVGIGTPRVEAHRLLGMPEDTLSAPWTHESDEEPQGWYDDYDTGAATFRMEYRADKKVYSVCMEPQLENRLMITNAEGTVAQLRDSLFVILPDFGAGKTHFTAGREHPAAFRKDSLRVVFTARRLPLQGRPRSLPMELINIEKLE